MRIFTFQYYRSLISVVFCVISLGAAGNGHYRFDALSTEAMNALSQLRIDEARQILSQAQKLDPENNIPVWLLNYTDFIEIIVTEDAALFRRYEKSREQRLNQLSNGDPSSPYHKFCQAEVNIQWAMARVKFKEYVTALREVNRSYSLLTELHDEHPDFKPALISLGFLHTLIGSVPAKYQWAVRMLGFSGDVKGGIVELKEAMLWSEADESRSFFNLQGLFFLSFVYLNADSDKNHAVGFMNGYMAKRHLQADKLEPLEAYALSGIALKTGNNQLAIRMLTNRARGGGRLEIPYLDYMTGLAFLADGDDRAELFLRDYAVRFNGRNFIKAAWQRLGWYYLLKGDPVSYRRCMAMVGTKGCLDVDADKAAQRDFESGVMPSPLLLGARLLSDGGYYDRAQKVLNIFYESPGISQTDRLEADYRQARIFDEQGQTVKAKVAYQKVYENGRTDKRYYAANSALKLAAIYERSGADDLAAVWYHRVGDLDFNEYRNSITQKAQAGYERTRNQK